MTPPPADKREPLHLRIHQGRAIAGTRPELPGPPERDAETAVAINAEDVMAGAHGEHVRPRVGRGGLAGALRCSQEPGEEAP